jgi:hypothetical protein
MKYREGFLMDKGSAILVAIWFLLTNLEMVEILVSGNAHTSAIQALSSGGTSLIGAAVVPVTGSSSNTTGVGA